MFRIFLTVIESFKRSKYSKLINEEVIFYWRRDDSCSGILKCWQQASLGKSISMTVSR